MADILFDYPDDFASQIQEMWKEGEIPKQNVSLPLAPLPSIEGLRSFVHCCYQASMKKEEGRPLSFRAVFSPRSGTGDKHIDSWQADDHYAFTMPRPATPTSLRKVAPASDLEKAVILMDERAGDSASYLEIWGLMHDDSNWMDAETGKSTLIGTLGNNSLCLCVLGPGQISAACGGRVFLRMQSGRVLPPAPDVYNSNWLQGFFDGPIQTIIVEGNERHSANPESYCDVEAWPVVALFMSTLKQLIHRIFSHGHGGSIVVLPLDGRDASPFDKKLAIQFQLDAGSRQQTLFGQMRALFHTLTHPGTERKDDVRTRFLESKLDRFSYLANVESNPSFQTRGHKRKIESMVQWMSALSQVDGSLVVNRRLEAVGFGALISGGVPDVECVYRANDIEGTSVEPEDLVSFGTRHRAMFRLCNELEDTLAVTVSQDGAIRFIKKIGERVVFWDQTKGTLSP